ncbi:MAG: agmatine deiminase family protein [Spirochaetes bacterium]|nr:agmatine deiminase family protein [Spirochaetota bacterium]
MTSGQSGRRRWPAEWERHIYTLLAWPQTELEWPGKLDAVDWAFAEIARLVTASERLLLVAANPVHRSNVRAMLVNAGVNSKNVDFLIHRLDRNWMRDSGPVCVKNGSRVEAIQFSFNAWANYPEYANDIKLTPLVARKTGAKLTPAMYNGRHVVLEGGAIDGNGRGTLITTEECLMHTKIQVRNPGFSKADYAAVFHEYLGTKHVIWLGGGIVGDDTHGHVDDICRFIGPSTLVIAREKHSRDINYRNLEENRERLTGARLADGSKPKVIELPMPGPVVFRGMRLPASYTNFLFTKDALLVPTFNDPNDRIALGILSEALPGRTVIGIHAVDIVLGRGTLHCLSHEIPA